VLRWEDGTDAYYMAADSDASGNLTFYGGKVDGSNAISNATSAVGIAYRPQASFPVTGKVGGNTLLLQADMSQFHLAAGSTLQGLAAYSLAGPSDASSAASSQIFTAMRTVDASPPMDAVLAAVTTTQGGGQPPSTPTTPMIASPNTSAPAGGAAAARASQLGVEGGRSADGMSRRVSRRAELRPCRESARRVSTLRR
jgi:hypothetical protein